MFTKKDINNHVLTLLGDNSISVEIDDKDWDTIHSNAIDTYNKYRPKVVKVPHTITQGVQNYIIHPDKIGRGVFHIPWKEVTDIPDIFPNTYTPITNPGSPQVSVTDYLRWKKDLETTKEVSGLNEDFEYNQDTGELTIYPVPYATYLTELHTMHNRYFDEIDIAKGDNVQTIFSGQLSIINFLEYKKFVQILPYKFRFLVGNTEILTDDGKGNLVSNLTGTPIGSISYDTGWYDFTLGTPLQSDKVIKFTINELRPNDGKWYMEYCYAVACRIIGNKAKRFSSIPGSQGELQLDVDKLQEGIEKQKELEEIAYKWLHEWFIPRMQ